MKITTSFIGTMLLAAAFCSCNRDASTKTFEQNNEEATKTVSKETMEDDLNKSKTILYTLPAPIEMASLIKETGAKLNDQLLANLSNAESYTTNKKMALNLGIYATDLSVAEMFNQSQRMVEYMNVIKDLTQKLGIVKVLNDENMKKLENTDLSKDDALNIISEVYMNTNQYLAENNRRSIATMVMAGGWLEGLYIAVNMVDSRKQNKEITERLIAQKLALTTIFNILHTTDPNGEDADLNYVKNLLKGVKEIFDEVNMETNGKVAALTDPNAKTTSIKANASGELPTEMLSALRDKVNQARNEITEIK